MSRSSQNALRGVILTPNGRDAAIAQQILREASIESCICPDVESLCRELESPAGFGLIAEEALAMADLAQLKAWVEGQPVWSDLPFMLLTGRVGGGLDRNPLGLRLMRVLGNVAFVERPFHSLTLVSVAESALRARARQYQAREMIEERARSAALLARSEEALRSANEALEARVADRTARLAQANERLVREIIERERAQSALLQSQKMEAVGQLTGGIAHDFNNLLTAMVGNLDLIVRRATDERILAMATHARMAGDRAAKLTSQLLAFSRDQRLNLKPVKVDQLILGMSDMLHRSLGPLVDIRTDLQAGGAYALADPNQLELAILNLSINGRDAMPDGGVLTIATAEDGDSAGLTEGRYISVSVTDTGTGIAPDVLSKVFDPFFTTKPVGKGTGLGLSQVYAIAAQSGGTARVTSELGHGATVRLLLPQVNAPETSFEAATAGQPQLTGGDEKVLVIDDDPDVRRFIVACLGSVGYSVTEAADGAAGLARLETEHPDLLIVDFAMPGMNGAEVASAARVRHPGLPILLASGYSETDAVQRVMDAGQVLRKPFDVSGLVGAVKEALHASGGALTS